MRSRPAAGKTQEIIKVEDSGFTAQESLGTFQKAGLFRIIRTVHIWSAWRDVAMGNRSLTHRSRVISTILLFLELAPTVPPCGVLSVPLLVTSLSFTLGTFADRARRLIDELVLGPVDLFRLDQSRFGRGGGGSSNRDRLGSTVRLGRSVRRRGSGLRGSGSRGSGLSVGRRKRLRSGLLFRCMCSFSASLTAMMA